MSEAKSRRSRRGLRVLWIALALGALAALWLVDYMGRFGMLVRGRVLADEIEAEIARRGVHCTGVSADATPSVSGSGVSHSEPLDQSAFIRSFSLRREEAPSPEAEIRLAEIRPSAPWLAGVRQDESIRIRIQCEAEQVVWCVETEGLTRRFHGPALRSCAGL